MIYALTALIGYLIGSVPFGLILTRLGGYGDIRDIGSGNIGATNVLRTGNKKLAMATLVLDALKGAVAVGFAYYAVNHLFPDCAIVDCAGECSCYNYGLAGTSVVPLVAGLFAIVGHLFPVWLKFRGGKGVATALGTFLALKPLVGIAACGLWLLAALITRYSSLSALIAIGLSPIVAHFLYHDPNLSGAIGVIATLVFFKHRANIRRLVRGEEPKIGKKA